MYQNPSAAVRTIASFLNIPAAGAGGAEPLTEEVVQKVVEHSSLSEMRSTSSFGLNHLRKGGYGGWRTMFTVAMSEFFDDVSNNNIGYINSDSVYLFIYY